MKFSKESLEDEAHRTVLDTIVDHRRWSVIHERVFEHEGKFYRARYRVPATESQDEDDPYDSDRDGMVECKEVVPVEVMVTQYRDAGCA